MSTTTETLRNILQTAPGNWFIRMLLVEELLKEQRVAEAAQALEVEDGLPYDRQFLIYAVKAHGMVNPVRGLEIAEEAIGRFPKLASAWFEKGNLLALTENREEAYQAYTTAQQLDSSLVNPYTFPPTTPPLPSHVGQSISLRESIASRREQLAANRRIWNTNDSIISLGTACIVLAIMCLLLLLIDNPVPKPSPPQIVATLLPAEEASTWVQPKIKKQTQKDRPARASSMAMNLVTSVNAAAVSVISFDTPAKDFGVSMTGLTFGNSMNFGGSGGEASVMFFGSKSVGKRFLFILDASGSMTRDQIRLRDKELRKALSQLGSANYHVILFGAGAHFVDKGWRPPKEDFYTYESPQGPYTFVTTDTGFQLENPENFRTPDWLKPGEKQLETSIRYVRQSDTLPGTDWDNALRMGHMMKPPPDVIFFMSDGQDLLLDIDKIIENNQHKGKPKINCLAMQTGFGAEQFSEISKRSGGEFFIIDKRGDPIPGDDYLIDPGLYSRRL